MKVLIAVTHLLGAGHLSRALTLARAFSRHGHEAIVLSGGRAAPHLNSSDVTMIQAPSLASDGTDFTRLLEPDGVVADADYLRARAKMMAATVRDLAPDVVITELFPFGRRALATEFLALLEASKALARPALVLASVRDILAPPSKQSKADRARELLLHYYDGVLVHSDASITRLQDSWPLTDDLEPMLHYTGYVAPPPATAHPTGDGAAEVLVSAGGGSVGQALFECAIEAARNSEAHWRLLVGGGDHPARIVALKAQAGTLDITIESVRADFRQMLKGAAASVSMCGYNTALDLLQTGIPAVLVPFDDGGEVEQTLRSRALAAQPGIEVLLASDATPARLSEVVARVMRNGPRSPSGLRMQGADESVRLVELLVVEAVT